MAEFVAPQFNNPDFLRSAALGQQMGIQAQLAPGELQGQQQGLQQGQLTIDQLRQTLQTKGLINQYAQKLASQDDPNGTQSAQAAGGGTGGIQNGPQGSLTQPATPGGPSTGTMMALDVLQGRDPLQTQRFAQENQLAQKKLQLAGPINLAVQVAQDPRANVVIANNPSMLGGFKQWAAAHGLDPNDPTNLTVANAQAAAKQLYSNLKAQVGESGNDLGFSGTLKAGEAAYKNGQMVAGSTDAVTPYQKQEMDLRQQEFQLAQRRFSFDQNQSKIPSGYQVNAKDPTQIEPIPGGPATSAGLGGRDGVMFQRVTSAANAGVKAIENIAELPIATSSGIFGTAHPGTSLFGSAKSVLAQKITGQDAQTTNVMFSGLSRNLATLETAGLSPGGSLTDSLGKLNIGEGDTQMTKLRKLAEMRQIVEENLSPNLANPKLAQSQKDLVNGIIQKVQKAVPFTQHDITQFEASKNPRATIMDFAKSTGVQDQADKNSHPADVQALLDKYK